VVLKSALWVAVWIVSHAVAYPKCCFIGVFRGWMGRSGLEMPSNTDAQPLPWPPCGQLRVFKAVRRPGARPDGTVEPNFWDSFSEA